MRSIRFNFLRPLRLLLTACVCALLLLTAFPAYSAPVNPMGSRTAPQEGEEQLLQIEKETQEAVLKSPYEYDMKQTQAKANEGLNEVQGAADRDKMYRPENSQQATSVEQAAKEALESVKGKVGEAVESITK